MRAASVIIRSVLAAILAGVLLVSTLSLGTASAAPAPVPPRGGTLTGWSIERGEPIALPTAITDEVITAVAPGGGFTLALTSGGQVLGWGNNPYGALDVPASLPGQRVTAIAAGGNHGLALTEQGRVVGWGDEEFGQDAPPAALRDKPVTAIAAGDKHSLALSADGTLTTWGYNGVHGWVPDYKADGWLNPPRALKGRRVTSIAAAGDHSMALTADGSVVAWGFFSAYDDWRPGPEPALLPVPSSLNGKVVTAISTGYNSSLALTDDGTVTAWTWSDETYVKAIEVDLPFLDGERVVSLSASYGFSSAVTDDGRVVTWRTYTSTAMPVVPGLNRRTTLTAATNGDLLLSILGPDDTTPPALGAHADVSATATSDAGATVEYALPEASDNQDHQVGVACTPRSGSRFPVGSTTVTCTAADRSSNEVTSTFGVRVGLPVLSPTSGAAQQAHVGQPLPAPMVVTAQGADGQPLVGVPVTFRVAPPPSRTSGAAGFPGAVDQVTVTSDGAGRAVAPGLTGVRAGSVVVIVTTPAAAPLALIHDFRAEPARHADLKVSLAAPTSVKAGRSFRATVTLANTGPTTAHNPVVVVTVPSGLTITGGPGSYTRRVLTVDRRELKSGQSTKVVVRLKASVSARGSRRLSAVTTALETDPRPANNRASAKVRLAR